MVASRKTAAVFSATEGQARVEPMAAGLVAGRGERRVRMLNEVVDRSCQSDWIVEGDDLCRRRQSGACPSAYQYGVEVNRGGVGRDCEGECTGGDLFATPIRRDEDISATEQVGQLLDPNR